MLQGKGRREPGTAKVDALQHVEAAGKLSLAASVEGSRPGHDGSTTEAVAFWEAVHDSAFG